MLSTSLEVLSVLLLVWMLGTTWRNYPLLPARIPTHFGISGQPDGWGPRATIWVLPLVALGIGGMLLAIPRISPGGPAAVLGLIRTETLALLACILHGQIAVARGRARKLGPGFWLLLVAVLATSALLAGTAGPEHHRLHG